MIAVATIVLQPRPWTLGALEELERMSLIALFRAPDSIARTPVGMNLVETLYESDERYGPHKLICASLNTREVRLGFHPDNEEIFLPNLAESVNPCY